VAELSKAIARLMEERTSTPTQARQRRELFDRVRDRVAPGERAAAEALARLLLARLTPDIAERLSEETLAALCAGAYEFVAPPAEEPRVRVFNPEFARDGWDAPVTVIETLVSDRPFVVDTVRETLHQAGCVTRILLHPILGVERDAHGAVAAVTPPERSRHQESFIHAEVDPLADAAACAALEDDLRQRLGDLVLATNDYQAMRQATVVLASDLRASRGGRPSEPAAEEIAAFLEWLTAGHFVFLGYRAYTLSSNGNDATIGVQPGSGLGLLRKQRSTFADEPRIRDLDASLRRRILSGPPIVITKTTAESPVHRRARMDYIGVRLYDTEGRVAGEKRLIGLFTARAYGEESAEVPLLRRKLQRILQSEGAAEDSHDHREIAGLFNSTPKERLLAGTTEEIHADIRVIREARPDEVRVTARPDQLERGMFFLVVFPRESFSADLRRRIESMVRRTSGGTVLDQHVAMEDGEHVRLYFYVATPPEAVRAVRADALQLAVRELLRTWDDRLRDALEADGTALQPRALARQYAAIFPPEYKAATDVAEAVGDIHSIEELTAAGQPQVALLNPERSPYSTLKLYLMNEQVVLTDFLPVLENLGLKVYADDPIDVTLPAGGVVHMHAFRVLDATTRRGGDGGAQKLDTDRVSSRLSDAILAHRAHRLVDDELNALVLSADLSWTEVQVLRAYVNHAAQSGLASRTGSLAALSRHPASARAIWNYFRARFDRAEAQLPRERLATTLPPFETAFFESLDAVESISCDRTLRAVFATIAATTRTNAFHRRDDDPVAFKLDSENVAHLPRPRPRWEIFVYSTHSEGVHLRAGKIARGGLRLSDRPDDYRTEILGLMRTQVVKNAVIIPTGAKGGFVARGRGKDAASQSDVVAAYRTFVGALLSLTDNIVQGRVVAPPGVLYDEPDAYLVVAADKGTAAFSDVANDVAVRAGYWLGDAFASGGSHGYDHKKIGITARGAWECVRRHFREMEIDADLDPITAVGIGDMSGDVFGNGMLLSQNLHLRAAFDHRHIFLDPNPDAALAYAERARLFALPTSSWNDYDRTAISAGGGVFSRTAKKIPLSAEARVVLGVEQDALTGEELVRAVLAMEADLLWNGGIGTYVRASSETNSEVGDPANDPVRVSADRLRVRVVVEGGNLGFTQAARIEFALHGGRIHTDAIDNAGGVNLSDHEVNLKILLGPLVEAGEVSPGERNRILAEVEDEVSEQVLRTNRDQARALALDQTRSRTHLNQFRDLIAALEHERVLDRGLQQLPDKDALRRRRGQFLGLTRPELAALLAHVKLDLRQKLLASPLPDDPSVERRLHIYFPPRVLERHRHAVRNHRLRREIIAVQLTCALVDVAGVTFVQRLARDTASSEANVARAWSVAATLVDLDKILAEVATAPPVAEARVFAEVESCLERTCKWLLRTLDSAEPIADGVNRFLAPTFELAAALPGVLPLEPQKRHREGIAGMTHDGVEEALAVRLMALRRFDEFLEIAQLSAELDAPLRLTAEAFYRLAQVVDLDWVHDRLLGVGGEDRWDQRAVDGMIDELVAARRTLTRAIVGYRDGAPADGQVDHCIAAYVSEHQPRIEAIHQMMRDVKSAPRVSLAALVVIMRELRALLG